MTRTKLWQLAAGGSLIAVMVTAASAQTSVAGDPQAGRTYALKNCSSCHMVSLSQSPLARTGPSFQAIADMRSTTEMSLHAFLTTTHPRMPNYIVPPNNGQDVIAYILSLRK